MVTKEFKSQFKDEDIDKVFGADSEYDFLKRVCTVYYMYLLGLGRYSHYRYNIDTEINRYVSIGLHSVPIQMIVTAAKNTIRDSKLFVSNLTFIQLSKRLTHIEFDLNYVELILCK